MNKVAIIVRTKDRLLFLKRAIESISGQTFKDWEIIIVNDGGIKDDIEKFILPYKNDCKNKIKLVHNEGKICSRPAAANVGIKSSNSKYVILHDDDDSWEPEFLEKCINSLKNSKLMGVITYCNGVYEKIVDNSIKIIYKEPFNENPDSISLHKMAVRNTFPPISFLYDRKIHEEIGYYDEELDVLEDWEFNLRFLQKYNIAVIPELLANYHLRPDIKDENLTNTIFGKNKFIHEKFDTIIRNKFLSQDADNKGAGIGVLVNKTNFEKNESKDIKKHSLDLKNVNTEAIISNLKKVKDDFKDKNIYCYGAGSFFEHIITNFDLNYINIKGVFDKNKNLAGKTFYGYNVFNPSDMSKFNIDLIIITVINPFPIEEYVRKKHKGEIIYLNVEL